MEDKKRDINFKESVDIAIQCIKACREIKKYAYDICSNDYIRGDDVKSKLYCILEKYNL